MLEQTQNTAPQNDVQPATTPEAAPVAQQPDATAQPAPQQPANTTQTTGDNNQQATPQAAVDQPRDSLTPEMRALHDSIANAHRPDTLFSKIIKTVTEVPAAWKNGIEPQPRIDHIGENSWMVSLLLLMVILVSFNIRNLRSIIKTFPQDLFGGLRHHSNTYDDHTSNEKQTTGLMILLLCIFESAIMLRSSISDGSLAEDSPALLSTALLFIGLALAFYAGRLGLYSLVGYVFSDTADMSQWRRGFNASQMLLCIILAFPAVVALFSPSLANFMTIISIIAFFVCQLLFIAKSFRIFFNDYTSSLYFILYLCALEITPIFIVVAGYKYLISHF